jgi:hypothetical protein
MAAAVTATTVYLVWPAPQHVGGASAGSLHLYVTRPGSFLPYRTPTTADSPVMDFRFHVSLAAVRPGTTVHVTERRTEKTRAPLSPETAGAQAEGSLPKITLLS